MLTTTCYVCGAATDPVATSQYDATRYGVLPVDRGFCSDDCRMALQAADDACVADCDCANRHCACAGAAS